MSRLITLDFLRIYVTKIPIRHCSFINIHKSVHCTQLFNVFVYKISRVWRLWDNNWPVIHLLWRCFSCFNLLHVMTIQHTSNAWKKLSMGWLEIVINESNVIFIYVTCRQIFTIFKILNCETNYLLTPSTVNYNFAWLYPYLKKNCKSVNHTIISMPEQLVRLFTTQVHSETKNYLKVLNDLTRLEVHSWPTDPQYNGQSVIWVI